MFSCSLYFEFLFNALSTPTLGFYNVFFKSGAFDLPRPLGIQVIENVVFILRTAETHEITAIHTKVKTSKDMEQRINIKGCCQYVVADKSKTLPKTLQLAITAWNIQ